MEVPHGASVTFSSRPPSMPDFGMPRSSSLQFAVGHRVDQQYAEQTPPRRETFPPSPSSTPSPRAKPPLNRTGGASVPSRASLPGGRTSGYPQQQREQRSHSPTVDRAGHPNQIRGRAVRAQQASVICAGDAKPVKAQVVATTSVAEVAAFEAAAKYTHELRLEVVSASELGAPEYRVGDVTAGMLGSNNNRLEAVYVELELGRERVRGRPGATDSVRRQVTFMERHLIAFAGKPVLVCKVRDRRRVQAMLRGDPLIGEGFLLIGAEAFDGKSRATMVSLQRAGVPVGKLQIRYQVLESMKSLVEKEMDMMNEVRHQMMLASVGNQVRANATCGSPSSHEGSGSFACGQSERCEHWNDPGASMNPNSPRTVPTRESLTDGGTGSSTSLAGYADDQFVATSAADLETQKSVDPGTAKSETGVVGDGDLVLGKGSWATAFRRAEGARREALRLLFASGIVTALELSDDLTIISEEHINECIEIAGYMLRCNDFETWIRHPADAKKFFEEELTALYKEKFGALM